MHESNLASANVGMHQWEKGNNNEHEELCLMICKFNKQVFLILIKLRANLVLVLTMVNLICVSKFTESD